ncbi:carbohydrate sulfotransferase 6 [Aplysia californica]|uniref:Carbohydrate sulfotransferase 6 n=1 Tax=Aplysia californica TaxID=6500 RepID=A0ABM0JX57_APLCA|nr:carbohydrate sulfotransferase 6 [Aplysia californica]
MGKVALLVGRVMARVSLKQLVVAVISSLGALLLWRNSSPQVHLKLRAYSFPYMKSRSLTSWESLVPLDRNMSETLQNRNDSLHVTTTETEHFLSTHAQTATPGKDQNRRKKVIVMSYMRSGSTFTGDLFQFSPDVFYFYEPLLYMSDMDEVPRNLHVRRRLESVYQSLNDPPNPLPFTLKMLSCNVSAHDLRFLAGLKLSRSTGDISSCKSVGMGEQWREECARDIGDSCRKHPTVVAKILRLKMWEVEELLSNDPDLKVIHLVRDPRGVAVSRWDAHYFFYYISFCIRLNTDAKDSARMQSIFPGRILTIRYEDLAESPIPVARKLYEFAGIPWSDDVEARTREITGPTNESFREQKFGTKRKNSSTTATKWRSKIDLPFALNLQVECSGAMGKYGYRKVTSLSDVRNVNISLTLPSFDDVYSTIKL